MHAKSWLIGLLTGTVGGCLAAWYLLRQNWSGDSAWLRAQLHTAERQAGDTQRRLEATSAEAGDLRTRLARMQQELDALRQTAAAGAAPSAETVSPESPPADDLQQIHGIGPRISGVLNDASITRFSQLAGQDVEKLRDLLRSHNIVADPSGWPARAAELAWGDAAG
jgi:predicted flap endonuclease-1-like 5' DNA nuclease